MVVLVLWGVVWLLLFASLLLLFRVLLLVWFYFNSVVIFLFFNLRFWVFLFIVYGAVVVLVGFCFAWLLHCFCLCCLGGCGLLWLV